MTRQRVSGDMPAASEATAMLSRCWRSEVLATLTTHEGFQCCVCGGPVLIGDWLAVVERRKPLPRWTAALACCSQACRDSAPELVEVAIDEHERAWLRRALVKRQAEREEGA